jgi:hypothetical protein
MGDAMVTQGGRRTSQIFLYGVCSNFRSTVIREITTTSYDRVNVQKTGTNFPETVCTRTAALELVCSTHTLHIAGTWYLKIVVQYQYQVPGYSIHSCRCAHWYLYLVPGTRTM